jgi:hypothetical protein
MPLARPAPNPEEQLRMDRDRFSGKRLAVEILVGEASGLLTSYLLCNDSNCPGGVGNAMGGQGSLLYSYFGASPALTPFSMPGSPDESPADTLSRIRVEATISAVILPVCSALLQNGLARRVGAMAQRARTDADRAPGIRPRRHDRRHRRNVTAVLTLGRASPKEPEAEDRAR